MSSPNLIKLTDIGTSLTERHLQDVFEKLHDGTHGWRISGAPSWLLASACVNQSRRLQASGYRFVPDLWWNVSAPSTLLELKRAGKGEEIALVEVLHHAWEMRHGPTPVCNTAFPIPTMVTSYSPWTRSALAYLFEYGLQKTAVKFVEATYLENPKGGSRYLWLYEPFAEWLPTSDAPGIVSSEWSSKVAQWFKVTDSETWVGIPSGASCKRPFTPDVSVFVCGVYQSPQKYIIWRGFPPYDYYLAAMDDSRSTR